MHRAPKFGYVLATSRGAPDLPIGLTRGVQDLRLRPCPHDLVEQRLAKRKFPRIAPYIKTQPVRHVGEPDAGIRVGEPKRAAEAGRSKCVRGGAEYKLRERLDNSQAKTPCRRAALCHGVRRSAASRAGSTRRECWRPSRDLTPGCRGSVGFGHRPRGTDAVRGGHSTARRSSRL